MDKDKKENKKQEIEEKDNKVQETNPSETLKPDTKSKKDKKKKEKPKTEIEILKDKVKKLEKQVAEEKNKFAFLQAELENTRKHYIRQQEAAKKRTKINTITSFTPLIDSFELAFKSNEKLLENNNEKCQIETFVDGFEKLYENLKTIFDKYGVKPIEETNIPSDYRQHEVILRTINDELPEDTVLQIVHKGYKMNGEVIRPAKVVVSKKTPIVLPPEPISDSDNGEEKNLEEVKKPEGEKQIPFE
ncbi:nucleotide exchange factor GrpE [Promethearchaeum syntrophicum]|uniref:Nucleotide exchange factor GrpE n=1 Tax=Promethearchaeum syntrophicum TaxID=2594042 RepID=A0A5B9DAN4_9ARCH|nr:nucleotide exchange factor GrpE [Candidatus Prometheoarchaeum syntrophicum]QEE15830.1 heat shock protein GrpE [Candidatus Prometheoarchaeum syntrophicum]